jgi:uncharacterized protein (UPF0261 family)
MTASEDAPAVAVVATLDTKAEQVSFVSAELVRRGVRVLAVDCGVGQSLDAGNDPRSELLRMVGGDLELMMGSPVADRLATMRRALTAFLVEGWRTGAIAGMLGLGGGRGTSVIAPALAALPWQAPKILVSTVVAGRAATMIGASNTVLVPSVVDLVGLNGYLCATLTSAAACMRGLLDVPAAADSSASLGISALGATTEAAQNVSRRVSQRGLEPVVFHMSAGGPAAYERFAAESSACALADLTTADLADELFGGMTSRTPARLVARRAEVVQVVCPGGLDMVRIRSDAPVPAGHRVTYTHSPDVTLVRTTVEENRRLGREVADRLARSRAASVLVIPMGGFSEYDKPGGPFYAPECAVAFRNGAQTGASPVRTVAIDLHINDDDFAEAIVGEALGDAQAIHV